MQSSKSKTRVPFPSFPLLGLLRNVLAPEGLGHGHARSLFSTHTKWVKRFLNQTTGHAWSLKPCFYEQAPFPAPRELLRQFSTQ